MRNIFRVAALVGIIGSTSPTIASAQTTPAESPPGELMIVNNNLQEALVADDVADPTDMRNFVTRLLPRVPYVPDVLVLQEVIGPSAQEVVDFLEADTGYDFEILIAPGDTPYPEAGEGDPDQVIRDTAIVINATTVTPAGPSGFVQTRYDAADGMPGEPVRVKEHAYAGIEETASGQRFPFMSLHFVPNRIAFPDEDTGFRYKDAWSADMADFMASTFAGDQWEEPIIAGDFNNRRCIAVDETRECDVMPFWATLTETFGYTDAIYSLGSEEEIGTTRKRIDYMFGRVVFLQAASDLEYGEVERADPATYYSDHRLMWSVLSGN